MGFLLTCKSFLGCHLFFFFPIIIMKSLSADQTAYILSLLQKGQTLRAIADATSQSIYAISKLCQAHLSDLLKFSGGCPLKLSSTAIHHATWLITSCKVNTATATAKHLHKSTRDTFSDQTLHQKLKNIGLKSGIKAKHSLLTTVIARPDLTLQKHTSTGPWRTGSRLSGQMRTRLTVLGQMGGSGCGRDQERDLVRGWSQRLWSMKERMSQCESVWDGMGLAMLPGSMTSWLPLCMYLFWRMRCCRAWRIGARHKATLFSNRIIIQGRQEEDQAVVQRSWYVAYGVACTVSRPQFHWTPMPTSQDKACWI